MTKRILVIDDDDGIRDLIQLSLVVTANWHVSTAASGQEGLAKAIAEQPDAILLDLMMPGMDGAETFQRLQANPITNPIPILLLTAKVSPREHQTLITSGIAGLIVKPFKAQTLESQVRSFLNWQSL
jgi:CheY-like chemotaxis protein